MLKHKHNVSLNHSSLNKRFNIGNDSSYYYYDDYLGYYLQYSGALLAHILFLE